MQIFLGVLLFVLGICIQNIAVELRKKANDSKHQNIFALFLFGMLIAWVVLVFAGLYVLFRQAWWLPIISLIIGARFVKR